MLSRVVEQVYAIGICVWVCMEAEIGELSMHCRGMPVVVCGALPSRVYEH